MRTKKLTGLLVVCWLSRWTAVRAVTLRRSSSLPPPSSFVARDALLSTPQLIAAYGYPVESHDVKTEDGYILTLHRIPGRARGSANRVVLLQHGVLCSSADWVLMGPGKGFAYILSDAGYDVWMGNARGNTYSKGHEKALPKQQYWSFSFHEMGVYDVPAVIDYILGATGSERLHYVGHSMGTTMFYVMASERPEYNSKVRAMVSLAPVAFLSHIKSGLMRFLVAITDQLGWLLTRAGYEEFLPRMEMGELTWAKLSNEKSIAKELGSNLIFMVGGFDSQQLNKTMLPVIAAHTPAGTSTKVFQHYAQIAKSGIFGQMDLGAEENAARYGRPLPPPYELRRVTAPVALFTADSDNLCAAEDVNKLHMGLSRVIGRYRVPYSTFSHLDFLWATDAKTLVYDDVIRLLNNW